MNPVAGGRRPSKRRKISFESSFMRLVAGAVAWLVGFWASACTRFATKSETANTPAGIRLQNVISVSLESPLWHIDPRNGQGLFAWNPPFIHFIEESIN